MPQLFNHIFSLSISKRDLRRVHDRRELVMRRVNWAIVCIPLPTVPAIIDPPNCGWDLYDPQREFRRMGAGLGVNWRLTDLNRDYQLSPTYPRVLAVPTRITDTTLTHAAQYRSKKRFPAFVILACRHKL